MKSSGRLRSRLLSCLAIAAGLGVIAAFLFSGYLWDTLYARHVRAQQLWTQRKPLHYIYKIEIRSSFWTNRFQIEILNNVVQGTINLDSGAPAEIWGMEPGSYLHTTNALWQFLLIDGIFQQIHAATRPPRTTQAFLARTNPNLYYLLAMNGTLQFGWQGCEQAYPRVRYDAAYGYPSELHLYGQPCSTVLELNTPISLTIKDFQRLP